jgi:hypothetical protein
MTQHLPYTNAQEVMPVQFLYPLIAYCLSSGKYAIIMLKLLAKWSKGDAAKESEPDAISEEVWHRESLSEAPLSVALAPGLSVSPL